MLDRIIPNILRRFKRPVPTVPVSDRALLPTHPRRPCPLSMPDLPPIIAADPTAAAAHQWLAPIPWHALPPLSDRPRPGPRPAPRAPFLAAFLLKLDLQLPSMGHLRRYLLRHPALVWTLGFPLRPDPAAPLGFDVAASVPSRRQFARVLRTLPTPMLDFLRMALVRRIRDALPPEHHATFADTIAGDTKHILAWVKENNPNRFAPDRAKKQVQPPGDPDCRLGVKRRSNQQPTPTTDGQSPTQSKAEAYWGYASGIVVTRTPFGSIVLAEHTQPINAGDMTYFDPLMAQVEQTLGRRPRNGVWDAAFDSQRVYTYFHTAGGMAAVPVRKTNQPRQFSPDGLPLCAAGLAMPQQFTYAMNTNGPPQERARHRCPLLYPTATGEPCPTNDKHFATGGCVTTIGTQVGATLRWTIDRGSATYKALYRERALVEQINSQAYALGIEWPKLRRQSAVAAWTSLIYVVINLRVVHRQQGTHDPIHD